MILEWQAKTGLIPDNYTLGEILYMLQKIQERDRISWACSAQDSKLLPKKKVPAANTKVALQASVARVWPEALKPTPGKGN